MVLGLGMPEVVIIALVAIVFFFGLPKVKEWVDTFSKTKKETNAKTESK